ncbi:MAG: putative mRNA 3-end processing factor, partial [Marivirga sp.]
LFAYALGKAQRIMANIDHSIGKIYTHGAVENATAAIRKSGVALPDTIQVTKELPKTAFKGHLVIATPASIGTSWMNKFSPYSTGITSGWMMMRGTRRRKAADRGFVLSDHGDWNELLTAVKNSEAEKIYVTHGYSDVFSRHLQELGLDALAIDSLFKGESLDDND